MVQGIDEETYGKWKATRRHSKKAKVDEETPLEI